jgi:hypothetical protein
MDWFTVVSFIVSALSIPTLIGLVWKELIDKRKENSEERKKKRKEEFQENVREVIRAENEPIKKSINEMNNKVGLVSEGTLCSLRNDIKDCYYDCVEKGYRNDYDFQNIHDLYEAYISLGGNSFISDIMKRFDKIPSKDEYKKMQEEKEATQKTMNAPKTQIIVKKIPVPGKQNRNNNIKEVRQ